MTPSDSSGAGGGRSRALAILSAVLVVMSVAQFSLGSAVRITGSGDACPDWPTCFGSFVPPLDDWQVLLEWVHRLNGALLGVMCIVAVLAALYLWRRRGRHGDTALVLLATLVLVTVTGVIGGTVVLSDLDPALRTGHLVLALLVSFAASLALAGEWRPFLDMSDAQRRRGLIWGAVAFAAVLLVLVTGSYSVWRGAGLVCTSWPLCDGGVLPRSELQWISMTHRLTTGVAALLAGYGLHHIMRRYGARRVRLYAAGGLLGIVGTALLGAAVATTITSSVLNQELGVLNLNRILHISFSSAVWTAVCLAFASGIWARSGAGR